jgi:hypothetical protein
MFAFPGFHYSNAGKAPSRPAAVIAPQSFTGWSDVDKMTNKPACQGKGEWQWTTDTC